jgi:hypothetical protein
MGQELRCTGRLGEQVSEGRAYLETEELLFRGDFRLVIPLKDVAGVEAHEGWLTVTWPAGEAAFELGRHAPRWREKILHPPSLLDKLGVKPHHRVCVMGVEESSFRPLLRESGVAALSDEPVADADLIFYGAENLDALDGVQELPEFLSKAGALWIVAPKGKRYIRETDVLAAGQRAGLVDVKVARFSATHTAHKFVIPLGRR